MALESLSLPSFCWKKKKNRGRRSRYDYEQSSEQLEYIAKCLIELHRGGTSLPVRPKKAREQPISHPCAVCDRIFSSHQALGGHMASHGRSKSVSSSVALEIDNSSIRNTEEKLHTCGTCGKGFNTGQSLGGHMRKHYKEGSISSSPECDAKTTVFNPISTFDLNYPPPPERVESFFPALNLPSFGLSVEN